jgi:hypothetical protein
VTGTQARADATGKQAEVVVDGIGHVMSRLAELPNKRPIDALVGQPVHSYP